MRNFEMWKFPVLKPQEIQAIDEVLGRGIPKLLEQVEQKRQSEQENNPFFNANETNPFDEMALGKSEWIITQTKKQNFDQKFYSLSRTNGKASGGQIKQIMMQSQLSHQVLGKIWQLSDIDKDGFMDDQEFALCCFLIEHVKNGNSLPDTLPDDYIPPKYRHQMMQQRQQQQQQQQLQQQQQQQQQASSGGLPAPTTDLNTGGSAW